MAMELDDPDFHHRVLASVRRGLADGDRGERLLDLALARFKRIGRPRARAHQTASSAEAGAG